MTVICREAPAASVKDGASIAGVTTLSSGLTVTEKVSAAGPTLVTVTVSDELLAG